MDGNHTKNLALNIAESYAAGFCARTYIGTEHFQYTVQAFEARTILKERFDLPVRVMNWNRLCGFYEVVPDTLPKAGKLADIRVALNFALLSAGEIKRAMAAKLLPDVPAPFDPKEDFIIVFHELDAILDTEHQNGQVITLLRTMINACMGSPRLGVLPNGAEDQTDPRGKRMFVFLNVDQDLGKYIPELQPITVALPDDDASKRAMNAVFKDWIAAYQKNPARGISEIKPKEEQAIIHALTGMPYQEREDAIGLAVTQHRDRINQTHSLGGVITDFCESIEAEKAKYLKGLAGLTYVPKSGLPTNALPGYEAVDEYIDTEINIDPNKARKHALPPAKGLLLVGPGGTGKTEFSRSLARKVNRMLLQLDLGRVQGKFVGDSEGNMAKVMDAIRSMKHVVVFIDELEKLGVSAMEGGDGGGSSVWTRVLQMLLTEMTDPSNEAIFVFAANNVVDKHGNSLLPAPLIRAGRIDEKYWIELPDHVIREQILRVHIAKHGMAVDDDGALKMIAAKTDNWVGAELARTLVVKSVKYALAKGHDKIDTVRMMGIVNTYEPIYSQEVYKQHLALQRQACAKYTTVGISRTATAPPVPVLGLGPARSTRSTM